MYWSVNMPQARRSPRRIWVQRIVSAAVFGICTASVHAQFLQAPTNGKQTVLPEGGPAPGPRAGCLYQLDDGTQENQIGTNAQIAWMNKFTVNGCSVITAVDVAFGGNFAVPDGFPAKVCIWDDPNDDGDPSNAVLVVTQDIVVAGANTGIPTA